MNRQQPQHMIMESYGDYNNRIKSNNSLWFKIGGSLMIVFGIGGLFSLYIFQGLFFIAIGGLGFFIGSKMGESSDRYQDRINNAPISRVSYN